MVFCLAGNHIIIDKNIYNRNFGYNGLGDMCVIVTNANKLLDLSGFVCEPAGAYTIQNGNKSCFDAFNV